MQPLRIELLGGFGVLGADAEPCVLPARKARALLAYLALPPGRPHAREKLTALLWGDTAESHARQAFRQTLSRLRRALGPSAGVLVDGQDTVALAADRVWVDAAEFQVAASREQPAMLERAAQLYRGDLLEGLDVEEAPFDEWRTIERERLRELALEALARLLRHQMRGDTLDAAVQTALRILALDPLQEAVHRALMRLYVRQRRRAAALRQYQDCVQTLQRELGAEPEEPTRELYRNILRSAGRDDGPSARGAAAGGLGLRPAAPGALGELVGRAAPLATLERSLEQTLEAGARVAVVTGEAGIGKTRLLEEIAATAFARGVRVVLGRCYETEQPLPFRPWVDALRGDRPALDPSDLGRLAEGVRAQLGRLFPELPTSATDDGILPNDRGTLFEAVRELIADLAAQGPLLVVLEDVQWADPMSARLLAFLGRRLGGLPVLLAVSARPEDAIETPVLQRAFAELRDVGNLDQVPLGPLNAEESLRLARAVHRGGDPRVLDRAAPGLWALSEGNPFVIVETVRMLRDEPERVPVPGSLPPSVREAVEHRLARLSDPARSAATVAAVIGRAARFDLLRAASGLSEAEAAGAVEELVRRRVLDVRGELLDFCHDRLRRVVHDAVLPHRRALLHGAVAGALEAVAGSGGEDVADEIGGHYLRAGRGARAYPHLLRFAEQVQARYDFEGASDALTRAGAAAEQLPAEQRARARLEVGLARAGLMAMTGRQRDCLALLGELEALREQVGDPALSAHYYGAVAVGCVFQGRFAESHDAATRGLAEAERTGQAERIGTAVFSLGLASVTLGELGAAADHARRAVALLDQPRSRRWQAQAYWLLGQAEVMRGEFAAALEHADRAGRLADAAGDAQFRSFTTTVVAWVHAARGEGREAVARATEALALAKTAPGVGSATRTLGLAHLEAGDAPAALAVLENLLKLTPNPYAHPYVHALVCLAEACRLTGDRERALATARRAIELAQGAGNRFNLGLAERALARASCDPAEARAALDRSLVALDTSGAAVEAALTRLDLARVSEDAATAAAHVAGAIRTFAAAGAPLRVEQGREVARALGVRA
jgi:DNA-binding SARP family transcriptional activator